MLPSGRHPSDNAKECARRNRFQPQCPALIVLGPAEGSTLMVDASGAAVAEEHFPPDETVARYYESWRRCTVRVPTGGEPGYCTFLKARAASSIRVNDIQDRCSRETRIGQAARAAGHLGFATPNRRLRRDSSSLISARTAATVLSIVVTASASRINHRVDCGRRSTIHLIRSLT